MDIVRIEARKESPQWILTVTEIYKKALQDMQKNGRIRDKEMHAARLEKLNPEGQTMGHFFRGVF